MTNHILCDAKISDYLNNHTSSDVSILDFARAFDKIPHVVLLAKLRQLRLSDHFLQWIADFLRERLQRVFYTGAISAEARVTSCIIHGSFLGLTLFIGFINDLLKVIKACDMWLFADDSKAPGKSASETDCCVSQQDLNALGERSISNHLPLSIDKCACLHYGHNNPCHTYNINGVTIKNVDQCSAFGVLRTSNFR